jgi:adenylylsulfate kinase
VEIFVDTPLEICEQRDPKGLFKKARRGELTGFTGIDDPYEAPLDPELVIDASIHSPEEIVTQIMSLLSERHLIPVQSTPDLKLRAR